mmetsp:Transcript_17782/g.44377  ORF Transcript_17782/g.44377 Transcript_17782/m.44377 type:complete len:222 (+) Transcript_17782:1396-2061(+)
MIEADRIGSVDSFDNDGRVFSSRSILGNEFVEAFQGCHCLEHIRHFGSSFGPGLFSLQLLQFFFVFAFVNLFLHLLNFFERAHMSGNHELLGITIIVFYIVCDVSIRIMNFGNLPLVPVFTALELLRSTVVTTYTGSFGKWMVIFVFHIRIIITRFRALFLVFFNQLTVGIEPHLFLVVTFVVIRIRQCIRVSTLSLFLFPSVTDRNIRKVVFLKISVHPR